MGVQYCKHDSEAAATRHVNIHYFGVERMEINDNLPMQRKKLWDTGALRQRKVIKIEHIPSVYLSVCFFIV